MPDGCIAARSYLRLDFAPAKIETVLVYRPGEDDSTRSVCNSIDGRGIPNSQISRMVVVWHEYFWLLMDGVALFLFSIDRSHAKKRPLAFHRKQRIASTSWPDCLWCLPPSWGHSQSDTWPVSASCSKNCKSC